MIGALRTWSSSTSASSVPAIDWVACEQRAGGLLVEERA